MNIKNFKLPLILVLLSTHLNVVAQMPPPSVNVVPAQKTSLAPTVWVSGTVVSPNNSNVAADVSGRLISLASLGSKVNQGDIIAKIDDTTLSIQRDEHQANVENAKARLAFLESEVSRKQSLIKKSLTSQADLDQTVSDRDIARGNLAAAKARLTLTKQQIAYTELKAPFSGLVVERLSNQGEYVNAGNAIVRLVQTDNLEASIFAPITAFNFLQTGSMLAVDSALGNAQAPVKSVIPVADARSHLMEIRVDLSSLNWPVGLSLKAQIANGAAKEVIAVPRDALVLRRGGTSIFSIDHENKAVQIPVTVGAGAGELVEVIGDVKPGIQIVVRGAERLMPGQQVVVKADNANLVSGGQVAQ